MANYGLRERESKRVYRERERESELIYKRVVKKMRGRERERESFGNHCLVLSAARWAKVIKLFSLSTNS